MQKEKKVAVLLVQMKNSDQNQEASGSRIAVTKHYEVRKTSDDKATKVSERVYDQSGRTVNQSFQVTVRG
jgi:hypothetical protein